MSDAATPSAAASPSPAPASMPLPPAPQIGDWLRYLVGHRGAIERIASHPTSWLTGAVLTILTAFPRQYDQTQFVTNPAFWLFGPLLFSIVSGTWLYAVTYSGFAKEDDTSPRRLSSWAEWRSFLGLFWGTAPIAWIYALPVERWFDSMGATKANLWLLTVVSVWRVLLITRALQVATRARYIPTLAWVLLAAALEAFVVLLLGGHFSRAIMRSMGGMRNSPEEDLIIGSMNTVFVLCFWGAPIALLVALALNGRRDLHRLPVPAPRDAPSAFAGFRQIPGKALGVAALVWIGLAIGPQRELQRSHEIELLVQAGDYRAVLDHLAAHGPTGYAPARDLPPKPFERTFFSELSGLFGEVRESDPAWVQAHVVGRMNPLMLMTEDPWGHRTRRHLPLPPEADRLKDMANGFDRLSYDLDPLELHRLMVGLDRLPAGRQWLGTNGLFVRAMQQMVEGRLNGPSPNRGSRTTSASTNTAGWRLLEGHLKSIPTPASVPAVAPSPVPLPKN